MGDTKAFDQYWTIAKVKFDPTKNEVTWILVTKADFSSSSLSLAVTYFDEDEVRIDMAPASSTVTFQPQGGNFKKGERFRAVLVLPKEEQMQKVKSVKIAPPSSDYTRPAGR